MLILTDCPDKLTDFLPRAPKWNSFSMESLPKRDRRLWKGLGASNSGWLGEVTRPVKEIWHRLIIIKDAPTSQFDGLFDVVKSGFEFSESIASLALRGKKFHGRKNHPWAALEGNLHLTVHYAPFVPTSKVRMGFTMLPAVAAVDAIRITQRRPVQAGIKWVNDILMLGHKIGGVLTAAQIQGHTIEHVILGIGINIAQTPQVVATPFVPKVGCLSDLSSGLSVTLSDLFWAVLDALDLRYRDLIQNGYSPLFKDYREYSLAIGRKVRVWEDTASNTTDDLTKCPPIAAGRVRSINPDLSLLIEGHEEPIQKGRLAFEEACLSFGL